MITFRDFIIFLAENKCLGAYWTNLEKVCKITGVQRFNVHLDSILKEKPHSWLVHSFVWCYSNEGNTFWLDIDKCWHDRCREMNGL